MAEAVGDGAVEAVLISVDKIKVDDEMAKKCIVPRCPNYGLSAGCPPHVAGPETFRQWQSEFKQALFIRIEVPMENLLSYEMHGIMKFLHQVVAGIETEARSMGYPGAKAFAGNSCKDLFCRDHIDCAVVDKKESCRNPDSARPSMSGFGIDLAGLKKAVGWVEEGVSAEERRRKVEMGAVYGLILID